MSASSLTTVSRGDFRAARVLIGLTAAASLIGAVVSLWPSGPLIFSSAVEQAGPAYPASGLRPGVSVRYDDQVVWTLTDPTLSQRLLAALPGLVVVAGVLACAWCMWRLMDAVGAGEPFSRRSTRLVRALALVLIGVGILWPFAHMFAGFALVTQVQDVPSVLFTFNLLQFWPIVAGFFLLVLTEVFVRGNRLRDDVDGLV